jgi:ribonuclease HII
MLDYEERYYDEGYEEIVGIDEAGRGPLCGPVVAAAVILPRDYHNEHINDSKQLTTKKRETAYKEILESALAYGVGIVDAEKIDEINIYEATKIAMKIALEKIKEKHDLVLVDAMPLKVDGKKIIPIIKGDAKCECIAAASIIAKVTRDHMMLAYAKRYPQYGFEKNKGYGTKEHFAALEKYGPIEGFHRFTFEPIKSMILDKKR